MSLVAFQSLLARLVTSPELRQELASGGEAALAALDLTPAERTRAIRLAADRGVKVTATLIESFRLGKILALLPLTRRMLGDERLGEEARRFWSESPPRSFYAVDEGIGFCDYLQRRLDEDLRIPCLSDVIALERTMLELRRPSLGGGTVTRRIHLRYDAVELFGPLSAGHVPEHVRERPCVLHATAAADGSVTWAPARERA